MTSERHAYGTGQQVLRDAAVEVAKERGIAKLSLRNVAERGGVTHGLVRHHFGSRQQLVDAALVEASNRTHFLSLVESDGIAERIDEVRGELRMQYEAILSGDHDEAIDGIYGEYDREARDWAEAQGLPTDDVTVQLIGVVIDGISIGRLARDSSEIDFDAVLARLLELLRR